MSRKQAVAISTAAGGGMKSACRDMADSLEMWGVHKVYKLGVGVQATKPSEIPAGIQKTIEKKRTRWPGKSAKTPENRDTTSGRSCGLP